MNKTVLVIGKRMADEETTYGSAERLVDALQTKGTADVEFAYFDDFSFHLYGTDQKIINERTGKDIAQYNLVFFRDWFAGGRDDLVLSLALYLDDKDVPYLNREASLGRSRGKLSQHVLAGICGAPMPATFSGGRSALKSFIDGPSFFGYPCIVKAANASRGRDNYLAHNQDELLEAYDSMEGRQTLVQEFIPNTGDYRVLVHKDQVLMVIERTRPAGVATHLNNTSQGAVAKEVAKDAIPAEVIKGCATVAERLGRTFTGIDIIERSDRPGTYVCLEVNNMPQMETGALVDDKLAAFAELTDSLIQD